MLGRAAFFVSLSACSLDYLELHTDEPAGSGGAGPGGGAGSCACGTASETVIYDENFDGEGWCNPDIAINARNEENATLDPDHVSGYGDVCEGLRIAVSDESVECLAHTYDRFEPPAGALYVRVRLKLNAWPYAATQIRALDMGDQAAPGMGSNVSLEFLEVVNEIMVRLCGDQGCTNGELVTSDDGWHTIVIFNPNDGVGYLQYRWDGGSIQDIPAVSWDPKVKSLTTFNIGWIVSTLVTPPDFVLDDFRICNENGAADCGWE